MVRLKSFLLEAEGPMLIAIVLASILTETGLIDVIAVVLEPVLATVLGLPGETVIFLILGVIRREMAVAPLLEMDLNSLQIFVGAAVSLFYIPCLSVFGVIAKEFNARVAVAIGISTFSTAILVGAIINFIGQLFI